MRTFAIDFESFYSKDCEIRSLGAYHYLNDLRCHVYLVSFAADDGFRWVGQPEDFDWGLLNGNFLVAHNLSWDGLVFAHLVQNGVIPKDVKIAGAACTANLAVFCGAGRSLKDAAHSLLGVDVSKDERKWMRGKTWADAVAAGKSEDIKAYALRDAEVCLALWEKYSARWPAHERELARLTMLCGWKGVRIDASLVQSSIESLQRVMFDAVAKIPWADGEDATVLSPKALGEQCRIQGIAPPPSLAEDDPGCEEWERIHGERFPWVASMRDYRKANILLKKFQAMRNRTRPTDGCMGFGLKYFGSHTGRWSGDGGFNCLTGAHEVLTPEGWVRLDTWDERVAPIMQWHSDSTLSFVRASKVVHEHIGQIVEIDNVRVRLAATPDHRVVYRSSTGAVIERSAQTLVTSRMSSIPTHGVFDENESERSDAELRFLVALAADGTVNANGAISFGFKKSRKIVRLREILDDVGCAYREVVSPSGVTHFYIKSSDREEWMVKGYSSWVLDLSHDQALVVLDELEHWDGTRHPKSSAVVFCTSKKVEAEWVATLAHIHGKTVSVNRYKNRWDVYFKHPGSSSHITPSKDVSVSEFSGLVYCPQVPTGIFLVRYQDRIHVTGNCQNLPREATFGVDLRRCIVARPGRKFIVSDLSQIEPRVMAWLCGEHTLLDQLRKGVPLYEAHARQTMGWKGGSLKKEDPRLYALAKARVLGLGYGCGPDKFVAVARTMGGIELSASDARATVTAFRQSNRGILALWNRLGTDFKRSVREGTYEVELPSGRTLTYYNVSSHGGWTCQTQRGGPKVRMYGGKLAENLVQAVARDVFAEALLRLAAAGIDVVLHCHDEVVCEVPIDTDPADIERLMSITPDWLPGCPLAAESVESEHYLK